jgi:hypothetical protein
VAGTQGSAGGLQDSFCVGQKLVHINLIVPRAWLNGNITPLTHRPGCNGSMGPGDRGGRCNRPRL